MKQEIFRKESLERLSSPEQLDSLVRITTPVGWLALIAMGLILSAALIWGFLGSIPTIVTGNGILIKTGGVYEVVAKTNGQIYDIRIKQGENVTAGQVVARVSQPDLLNQINSANKDLEVFNQQYRFLKDNYRNNNSLNAQYNQMQKTAYLKRIQDAKKQLAWLGKKIGDQEALLKDGLITGQELMTTKQQYDAAESDIKQYESQIEQLSVQKLSSENVNEEKLLNLEQQIRAKQAELNLLRSRHEMNSAILSPFTGQVLSVMSDIGSLVREDTPVLSLQLTGRNIGNLAVTYVTAAEGKLIRTNMNVQLSPAFAKKDEFGYMEGRVLSVSPFPSSPEEMMDTFHNKNLVDELSKNGRL